MRPMHGDDLTGSLRNTVQHLSPSEAADLLAGAWDGVQRRRFRNRLIFWAVALTVAFVLGFSLR